MKAVDIIVELDDRLLFVEFKDPDNPGSTVKQRAKYIQDFMSGSIDSDLQYKYRDSYLYELASGRVSKPIYYLVLIGAASLSGADLLVRTDSLKRKIPVNGVSGKAWKNPIVAGCVVLNLATWNETLPKYPVSRISA